MTRRHFFAPGVIDGPYRTPKRWSLVRAISVEIGWYFCGIAGLLAACAVLGFAAGFLGLLS